MYYRPITAYYVQQRLLLKKKKPFNLHLYEECHSFAIAIDMLKYYVMYASAVIETSYQQPNVEDS